jgi:hypothetical protein
MRAWVGRYPVLGQVIPRLLQELAADPDAHPASAPTLVRHTNAYFFLVTPEDGMPENVHLTFHIERHEAGRELRVVGGLMRTDRFPD